MTASTRARPKPLTASLLRSSPTPPPSSSESPRSESSSSLLATTVPASTSSTNTTPAPSDDVGMGDATVLQPKSGAGSNRRLSSGSMHALKPLPSLPSSTFPQGSTTGSPAGNPTSVTIPDEVVDRLPNEVQFPKKGYKLHPSDEQDSLLLLCARAVVTCDNRALTPKEIALICTRKWGYKFHGSQPFAVVSSCIRSHLRRAAISNPPYSPLFSTYELASVPPLEDIPCIGIEPDARPVVKRGTFWFLSETAGFPSPFPHRTITPTTSSYANGALHPSTRSGLLHGGSPANITVSILSQTKPKNEEKPLTRAQANATKLQQQQQNAPRLPAAVLPIDGPQNQSVAVADVSMDSATDHLGRGKRKRTGSAAINATNDVSDVHVHPQLHPILPSPSTSIAPMPATTTRPLAPSTSTKAAASKARASSGSVNGETVHRRAQSTSASDAQKPLPALRKLKLKLSTLSDGNQLRPTSNKPLSKAQLKAQLKAQQQQQAQQVHQQLSLTQQQPLSKRQRTQSMSSFPAVPTATFPFDNLHLTPNPHFHQHHSSSSLLFNTSVPGSGTLFPLDMHTLPTSPSSPYRFPMADTSHNHFITRPLDLLTSRSAPENNPFASSLTSSYKNNLCGLFSRKGSPSTSGAVASSSKSRRSPSSTDSDSEGEHNSHAFTATRQFKAGRAGSSVPIVGQDETEEVVYDGWAAGHRSLTDSAILAAQQELSLALSNSLDGNSELGENDPDFHEAMLKDDIDFEFDFSLDNLEDSTRQQSVISEYGETEQHHQVLAGPPSEEGSVSLDSRPTTGRRGSSTLDLKSLSDDVDGIFEGLNANNSPSNGSNDDSIASNQSSDKTIDANGGDVTEAKLRAAELLGFDGEAIQQALDTTLCPAASGKPSRLLARRLNSASSLVFPRLSQQGNKSLQSPLLRPAAISRTNSRDILNNPVPLADLPSLALQSLPSNPILLYAQNQDDSVGDEEAASDVSSVLTPIIKAEEDMEDINELELGQGTDGSSGPSSRALSRSCSSLSVSEVSADSFNPDTMVLTRAASEAFAIDTDLDMEQIASRSQSSSRATSLSPRDSFSPQTNGPNADWALTPPSEEEHIDEEEKNLDRAALLGPESVGMDDLDDAWPGSRSFSSCAATIVGDGDCTEKDAETSFKIFGVDVFEPVLSPIPIPPSDLSSCFVSRQSSVPLALHAPSNIKLEDTVDIDMEMDIVDETSAAAMFIADDGSVPPVSFSASSSTSALTDLDDSRRSSIACSPAPAADEDEQERVRSPNAVAPGTESPASNLQNQSVASPADPPPAAATQSFLFYPETPFQPDITILLTDTKILFYSTLVIIDDQPRPLLRRVDNDAVDAEPLLLSLQGKTPLEAEREDALTKIRELGNTWVSLEFARDLLNKFGGPKPELNVFLSDDILLSWNDKLVKLGTMLRQKNGLPTPVVQTSPRGPSPTAVPAQTVKPVKKSPSSSLSPTPVQPKPIRPAKAASSNPSPTSAKHDPSHKNTHTSSSTQEKTKKPRTALSSRRSTRNKP